MKKRRALILYATMTRNTEQVAGWFRETFKAYNWDVTCLRLKANLDWDALQPDLYFDDYDVVCLGSPIVGGGPLQAVVRAFSFGGDGGLEKKVQEKLDQNLSGTEAAEGAVPPKGPMWRRNAAPYAGVLNRSDRWPLGIVFTTYGGGFYGTGECIPTLEMLKLYLQNYSVNVVGKYSCAGRETGPGGIALGVKPPAVFIPGKDLSALPKADVTDAVTYEMADGTEKKGCYFFHYDHMNKPGPREEARARILISDFIEDYFMSYDGAPNIAISELISLG